MTAETICLIILIIVFTIFAILLIGVIIWTLITAWDITKETMMGGK